MKETEKKKRPSDYPQLVFRVSQEDKERILKEIESVTNLMNRGRSSDERVIRGNHIAVEALTIGLAELKKRNRRS